MKRRALFVLLAYTGTLGCSKFTSIATEFSTSTLSSVQSQTVPLYATFDNGVLLNEVVVSNQNGAQRLAFVGLFNNRPEDELQFIKEVSNGLTSPRIDFEDGNVLQRNAELVPLTGTNYALHFWIKEPNVDNDNNNISEKGRVQMNFYGNREDVFRDIYFATRVLLPEDIGLLKNFPESFHWLTLSEWWNNAPWDGSNYPFRITLDLAKPQAGAGNELRFYVRGSVLVNDKFVNIWEYTNMTFQVPIGNWVKFEYRILEGDAQTGRFVFVVTGANGVRHVVFDLKVPTHHPDDPLPDGFTHFNPVKLYTGKRPIDFVRSNGGILQVFWDDLDLRPCENGNKIPLACPDLQ